MCRGGLRKWRVSSRLGQAEAKWCWSMCQQLTEEQDDEACVGRLQVEHRVAESAEGKGGDRHVGGQPQRSDVGVPPITRPYEYTVRLRA